jgi:lysophospholipid acyltransferase (LPLAT)-like uncharacterized protein
MGPGRRLAYGILAPLIAGTLRLLWASIRIERVVGAEHLDAVGGACIPCFWHHRTVLCLRFLLLQRARGIRIAWLISPSVDGELATMVAQRWGIHVVRGSATRTGVKAMRDLYRAVRRERVSPIITPDGPSGPPGECKPGAVMLAQLAEVPMLPISWHARRTVRLPTWDRVAVPLPFTRATLVVGEPIAVARDLPADALDGERQRLQAVLRALEGNGSPADAGPR